MNDRYGSVLRESMKRSMEQPWRATNRREPRHVEGWMLAVFMGAVLAIGGVAVMLFNVIEGFFR